MATEQPQDYFFDDFGKNLLLGFQTLVAGLAASVAAHEYLGYRAESDKAKYKAAAVEAVVKAGGTGKEATDVLKAWDAGEPQSVGDKRAKLALTLDHRGNRDAAKIVGACYPTAEAEKSP